jgi:hypothetical protein
MRDTKVNQMAMIGASIEVAEAAQNRAVWENQPPLDFGTGLAALKLAYVGTTAIASQAELTGGGAAVAKDAAETELEDKAFEVARALAFHFKKENDLVSRAKVDVTITAIRRLRDEALVSKTTEIRDLGKMAVASPNATGRGITAATIMELTAAITAFATLRNGPRGQTVTRSSLLRELERRVAELVEAARDLDDLVVQFEKTSAGRVFSEAWKRARQIVDLGHRFEPEVPPSTPAPTPAQPVPTGATVVPSAAPPGPVAG